MDIYDFNKLLIECRGKDDAVVLSNGEQSISFEWFEDSWTLYGMSNGLIVMFDKIDCQNHKNADLLFKGVVVANIDVSRMEVVE